MPLRQKPPAGRDSEKIALNTPWLQCCIVLLCLSARLPLTLFSSLVTQAEELRTVEASAPQPSYAHTGVLQQPCAPLPACATSSAIAWSSSGAHCPAGISSLEG